MSFMRKIKKRILILTPFFSPNLGGVETHLNDLYEHLRTNNFFVYVLTYQPLTTPVKGKTVEKKKNLEIHRFYWLSGNLFPRFEKLPPIFNFLYLTPYLGLKTFIFLLINKDKVDIIHGFGLNAAFIARCLKIIFGKKIVMSTEALYGYKRGTIFANICSWVLKGFDKILAQSEASKEEMIRIGVPEKKIKVFAHWVNQKKFKPGNKRKLKKQLGWDDKFTTLFLGRLIESKGIHVVLEVAKKTKKEINFKIIGDDGPELQKVKEAEAKLDNLEYIGRVSYENLPPYYGAADVFLYPALYQEDMSRAILELLSCGTPVINTNKGSGIYALDDSVAIITEPDPDEIKGKLEFLFDHPKKLTQMTKNCRPFAKKFGPSFAKIITKAYEEIS